MAKNNKSTKSTNKNYKKMQHNKVEKQLSRSSGEISTVIKTLLIIAFVFVVFYLLTVFILNRKNTTGTGKTNASIQYSEILAGESFTQNNSDYIVVFYDKNGSEESTIADFISAYKEKEKSVPIYTVNLGDGINNKYKGSGENKNPSDASELKLSGSTLIRIKDKKLVDYITGSDIETYLNQN